MKLAILLVLGSFQTRLLTMRAIGRNEHHTFFSAVNNDRALLLSWISY